jgi:hypothetical protein
MTKSSESRLLGFLVPLIMMSCQDSPTASPIYQSPPDFPNSRGTQWTYLVEKPLSQETDTVRYLVGDTITLHSGALARIWQISIDTWRDSQFVWQHGDTIEIFDRSQNLTAMYMSPPVVGHGWSFTVQPWWHDTSFVATKDTILTPAGTFANAYRIQHESTSPFAHEGRDTTWLVPRVGIAEQRNYVADNLSFNYWKLTLISFNIVP